MMKKWFLGFMLLTQAAMAQQVTPPSTGSITTLSVNGTSVGNGADTTEDTLMTYTVPANTLVNVGDMLHIIAGGTFAATTDNKTVRVRFGGVSGVAVSLPNGSAAGQTGWYVDAYITKTGASTQSYVSGGLSSTNANGTTSGTASKTDTATQDIVVTGRNVTSSAAGSITCQMLVVQYIKAPGT